MYANDLMQVLALIIGLGAMVFAIVVLISSLIAGRFIVSKSTISVAVGVWILCSVLFDMFG